MRENVWRKVCELIDQALAQNKMTDQVNIAIDGMCGAFQASVSGSMDSSFSTAMRMYSLMGASVQPAT